MEAALTAFAYGVSSRASGPSHLRLPLWLPKAACWPMQVPHSPGVPFT